MIILRSLRTKQQPRQTAQEPKEGEEDMATYSLRVNGVPRTAESDDPEKPLLYVLRDSGLTPSSDADLGNAAPAPS
jgi:hypothetical protein